MPYCDECGFYLETDPCETCAGGALEDLDPDVRADMKAGTSRFVFHAPFVLICTALLHLILSVSLVPLYVGFLLCYGYAVIYDVRYLNASDRWWNPSERLWWGLVLANVLSAGLLTFLLSPYYMFRRSAWRLRA